MKQRSINGAVILAFVLWFGSYAYLEFYLLTGFKPLYSDLILLFYFFVWLILFQKVRILGDQGILMLLIWMGLYLAYGILAFINSSQDNVAVQAFITLGESISLCAVFVLIFADQVLMPKIQAVFATLAVLGTTLNVYDFLNPVFTNVPGRAAGLYVNANIAGHFIAMAMVVGVESIPRRWRVLFVVVCGFGVLLTFSRAAWILWGVAVVWLGWQRYIGPMRNRLAAILCGAVIGIGFLGLVFTGGLGGVLGGTSFGAHLDPNTEARLGIGASSLSGHSAHEREKLIFDSLRVGSEAPIVGHGLGYTDEWQFHKGPHNMYLLFFVDGGLFGVVLYLMLMVLLWRYSAGVGRMVALQLIIAGMFTHNQLEQPAFLMIMAFVVAHDAVARRRSGAGSRDRAVALA